MSGCHSAVLQTMSHATISAITKQHPAHTKLPIAHMLGHYPDTMSDVLQTMPHDVFVQLYERPRIPVVITGLQEDWKAKQLWNTASLHQRFADHKFKV